MGYFAHEAYKVQSPQMAVLEPEVARPEELDLLESLRSLGMKFAQGGYVDQPWLLIKTLEAAAAGKNLYVKREIATTKE